MALTDSLIAAWELNEASGTRVNSVNPGTDDLADNNTVASATGLVYALAGDFESSQSEYLSHGDDAALSCGDIDFTIEAWVKAESLPSPMMIITKGDAGTSAEYYLGFIDTLGWTWSVFGGGGIQSLAFVGSNPSTGVWYHLIAYHDSVADLIGLIVNDGTPITDPHTPGVHDSTFPLHIGALSTPTWYFDGLIGPVRFWKRMLTAGENTSLYNDGAGLAYTAFSGGGLRVKPVFVAQAPHRASFF